jgi:hypothetical protein
VRIQLLQLLFRQRLKIALRNQVTSPNLPTGLGEQRPDDDSVASIISFSEIDNTEARLGLPFQDGIGYALPSMIHQDFRVDPVVERRPLDLLHLVGSDNNVSHSTYPAPLTNRGSG